MSLFEVKPLFIRKKDGTKKQAMPQTTIEGVIGLPKELKSIKTFIENLTGKKIDKNYPNKFLTKKDLEDYVTSKQLTQSTINSKDYADLIVKTLKESLPDFDVDLKENDDLDNFQKNGTYNKQWGISGIQNFPIDSPNCAGQIRVIRIRDDNQIQIWINSLNVDVRMRFKYGNPGKWTDWNKVL